MALVKCRAHTGGAALTKYSDRGGRETEGAGGREEHVAFAFLLLLFI